MSRRRPRSAGPTRRLGTSLVGCLVAAVLLGACGGGSRDSSDPVATPTVAPLPDNLCEAVSAALAATPDLGVAAGDGTPSSRRPSTKVCTLSGDTVQLELSATPNRSADAAGAAADLRAACALLQATTSDAYSRASDSCSTSSGDTAPGEVVSVSELTTLHALLVIHATSTSDSGAILAARVSQLELAAVS